MIPKYEDLDRINNISAELAARFAVLYDKIVALEIENERLRDERDHARRLHCYDVAATIQGQTAKNVAKNLEWNCFKEHMQ